MPRVVDYEQVLARMTARGMRSLYHNSGAFALPSDAAAIAVAWTGPDDPTIRPAARAVAIAVPAPHPPTLARLARRAWQEHLPGPSWVLPMSHWSHELDFAGRDWLPDALRAIEIDPAPLSGLNKAAAIEFAADEPNRFESLASALLSGLKASDFAVLFPDHPVTCMIHHHQQLWWQTTDAALAASLRNLALNIPRATS